MLVFQLRADFSPAGRMPKARRDLARTPRRVETEADKLARRIALHCMDKDSPLVIAREILKLPPMQRRETETRLVDSLDRLRSSSPEAFDSAIVALRNPGLASLFVKDPQGICDSFSRFGGSELSPYIAEALSYPSMGRFRSNLPLLTEALISFASQLSIEDAPRAMKLLRSEDVCLRMLQDPKGLAIKLQETLKPYDDAAVKARLLDFMAIPQVSSAIARDPRYLQAIMQWLYRNAYPPSRNVAMANIRASVSKLTPEDRLLIKLDKLSAPANVSRFLADPEKTLSGL